MPAIEIKKLSHSKTYCQRPPYRTLKHYQSAPKLAHNFEAYLGYDEGVSYVDGVVYAESDADNDGGNGECVDCQPQ